MAPEQAVIIGKLIDENMKKRAEYTAYLFVHLIGACKEYRVWNMPRHTLELHKRR